MHVLHVVSYFPPDRIGGVGEVVAHLHRGLLDRGHNSRVLTTGQSRSDPLVRRIGRRPSSFPFTGVAGCLAAFRADVVHAQHGEALPLLMLLRLKRSRPRIVVTFHSSNRRFGAAFRPFVVDGRRFGSGLRGLVQRLVLAPSRALLDQLALVVADEVTFVSRSCAEDLAPNRRATWNIIHNALPHNPVPSDETTPADLLYVGRPSHLKRVLVLPYVLAKVRVKQPRATLRIVGFDRATNPRLANEFDRRGLSGAVFWEGAVPSDEIGPFYASATALLLPSAHEGLPMVVLEAASAGTPTVATAVGGLDEVVIDGVTGLLVPPASWDGLVEACLTLLGNPALARDMGAAACDRVARQFGRDVQVDQYLGAYGGPG